MNTFIRTKQHIKKKKEKNKNSNIQSSSWTSNKWYTKSTAEHCGINIVLNTSVIVYQNKIKQVI